MPVTFFHRTVLHFRTDYRILCTNKLKVFKCLIDLRNRYILFYIHKNTFIKILAYMYKIYKTSFNTKLLHI